jgi:hypothetical protein
MVWSPAYCGFLKRPWAFGGVWAVQASSAGSVDHVFEVVHDGSGPSSPSRTQHAFLRGVVSDLLSLRVHGDGVAPEDAPHRRLFASSWRGRRGPQQQQSQCLLLCAAPVRLGAQGGRLRCPCQDPNTVDVPAIADCRAAGTGCGSPGRVCPRTAATCAPLLWCNTRWITARGWGATAARPVVASRMPV